MFKNHYFAIVHTYNVISRRVKCVVVCSSYWSAVAFLGLLLAASKYGSKTAYKAYFKDI